MAKRNTKYAVKPEVLAQIEFTSRDKELAKADLLIQGIISTPPENWTDAQAFKAKYIKLSKMSVEQLRWFMDNEVSD